MSVVKRILVITALTAIILPYQNCSFVPGKALSSSNTLLGGDGEGFPGIQGRSFYSFVTGFKCPDKTDPVLPNISKIIEVPTDKSVDTVKIIDTCSRQVEVVKRNEIFVSKANENYIGKDKWIAEYKEKLPEAPPLNLNVICEGVSGWLANSLSSLRHLHDNVYIGSIDFEDPNIPDETEERGIEAKLSPDGKYMIYKTLGRVPIDVSLAVRINPMRGSYLHEGLYYTYSSDGKATLRSNLECVVTNY